LRRTACLPLFTKTRFRIRVQSSAHFPWKPEVQRRTFQLYSRSDQRYWFVNAGETWPLWVLQVQENRRLSFTKPILRNRQRWNLYWQPKYRTLHFGITEKPNCGGIAGCISLPTRFSITSRWTTGNQPWTGSCCSQRDRRMILSHCPTIMILTSKSAGWCCPLVSAN
jgi:hypothetical protein